MRVRHVACVGGLLRCLRSGIHHGAPRCAACSYRSCRIDRGLRRRVPRRRPHDPTHGQQPGVPVAVAVDRARRRNGAALHLAVPRSRAEHGQPMGSPGPSITSAPRSLPVRSLVRVRVTDVHHPVVPRGRNHQPDHGQHRSRHPSLRRLRLRHGFDPDRPHSRRLART